MSISDVSVSADCLYAFPATGSTKSLVYESSDIICDKGKRKVTDMDLLYLPAASGIGQKGVPTSGLDYDG